jgi:hypothetical protein
VSEFAGASGNRARPPDEGCASEREALAPTWPHECPASWVKWLLHGPWRWALASKGAGGLALAPARSTGFEGFGLARDLAGPRGRSAGLQAEQIRKHSSHTRALALNTRELAPRACVVQSLMGIALLRFPMIASP